MTTTQPSADKRGGAALCCTCGNLRSNPGRSIQGKNRDPNRTAELDDDARGWRMTRTLDCPICEQATVHAMLCSGPRRDCAEPCVYEAPSWWVQRARRVGGQQ
jgi:hypothetical protein